MKIQIWFENGSNEYECEDVEVSDSGALLVRPNWVFAAGHWLAAELLSDDNGGDE